MKPYPAYKPSGVPWLGEVPGHWDIVPIRYLSRGVKTGGTPSQEAFTDYPTENDIPWYAPADLNAAFLTTGSRVVSLDSIGEVDIFEPGTIAMVGIGDVGRVSILTTRATGNQQLNFIRPVESVLATFLTYALLAAQGFVQSRANVTLIPILNQENTKRLRMPTPPLDEQQTIATYLDHETARIDTLIAEKVRLIDTLREYRQATILEVVTQGLDPTATKKPSGVPWLGEVPSHWSIEKLKFFVRFVGGGTPSKDNDEYWGGDIPWVSPKDMKRPRIDDTEDKITEGAVGSSACTMIATGAVLVVVRSGILQHTIPIAINDVPVAVNQDMKALIPEEKVQSRFLAYQIQGCQRELREDWVKQGATVESVEQQRMADSRFAIPPPDEQEAIASYLDRETDRIDKLVDHAQEEIKLLQELRAATITDAVTGKIQVG